MGKRLTEKDISLIEALRSDPKENRTQANMKRLNRIMNRVSGKTVEYCLCSDAERATFHTGVFYPWYDQYKKTNG